MKEAAIDRFLAKIAEDASGCWLWRGAINHDGYGHFKVSGRVHRTHRWSYEHHVGPVPEGLVLDHLCRVRHCVNPAHLEPVTQRENLLRGDTIPARWGRTSPGGFMNDNPILAMGLLLVLWAAGMCLLARHERRRDARLTSRQLRRRGGL